MRQVSCQSHWGEEATVDIVTRLRRVHVSANIRRVFQIPSARGYAVSSINHSELSIVFATPGHIPALLKLAPKCSVMKIIVAMDPLDSKEKSVLTAWGESVGVEIKELAEGASCRPSVVRVLMPMRECSRGVWSGELD